MTVVTPPFLLDFAGAYLDWPPEFSSEATEYRLHEEQEQFGMRLLMGQIGEGVRWTAGILPELETRRGQAGRLRYVLPRLGLQVSSMAERGIANPVWRFGFPRFSADDRMELVPQGRSWRKPVRMNIMDVEI